MRGRDGWQGEDLLRYRGSRAALLREVGGVSGQHQSGEQVERFVGML